MNLLCLQLPTWAGIRTVPAIAAGGSMSPYPTDYVRVNGEPTIALRLQGQAVCQIATQDQWKNNNEKLMISWSVIGESH